MTLYDRTVFWLLTSGVRAPRPVRRVGELAALAARILTRIHEATPRVPEPLQVLMERPVEASPVRRPPRVVQCIGSLSPGGAERQYCNLAIALSRRGYPLRLLTTSPLAGAQGHYASLLRQNGLVATVAGEESPIPRDSPLLRGPARFLPAYLVPSVLQLAAELAADPPDVVHAWLDHTNVWAGIAGLLTDVPVIVLSTRNVNPSHFPYLDQPWFRPWYSALSRSPRVHFINNSRAGARDYAEWLGIPRERFSVVLNGLDPETLPRPAPEEVQEFRRSIGLGNDHPLVGGIFRLSDEKEPLVFVEVVTRVLRTHPAARAALVGVGPLESDVRQALVSAGLTDRCRLLGNVDRIPAFLSACHVLLHTSRHEGTPNSLLEAQYLGCPPVATAAAGTRDAVLDDTTGFLLPVGDVAGLAARVLQVIEEPATRRRLSLAGPVFVQERFGLQRMVDETVEVYDRALSALGAAGTVAAESRRA